MTLLCNDVQKTGLDVAVVLASLVCIGSFAPVAMADGLPYTANWNVTFDSTGAPSGDYRRAFGSPSNANGEMTNLDFIEAHAKAEAVEDSTIPGLAGASSTSVGFDRPFTLPAGGPYTVTITGRLKGSLYRRAAGDFANVVASASIEPAGGGPAIVEIVGGPLVAGTPPSRNIATGNVTKSAMNVPAGNYVLKGTLSVNASTTSSAGGGVDDAASFFFEVSRGFNVSGSYCVPPAPRDASDGGIAGEGVSECESVPAPAISRWGIVLAVFLFLGALIIKFARRRAVRTL